MRVRVCGSPFPLLLLRQASINGLYKTICRYETLRRNIFGIVVPRWAGSLDLVQRHALLDHVPDAVSNDDHHIPVFHNVSLIRDPSMTRHDVCAAFLRMPRNREGENVIERGNFSVQATASFQIDKWIGSRCEDVT